MPSDRRLLRTQRFGSWWLGPEGEGNLRLRVRVQLLLTGTIIVANIIGIVVASTLTVTVIPGPHVLIRDLAFVNFVLVPAYALLALVVGAVWGTRWVFTSLHWFAENRPADRRDRIQTLRVPWKLTAVSATLWFVGTIVFSVAYGMEDVDLVAKVGITSAFAGAVVAANTYLLSEFALRPFAARALSTSPMRETKGIGITMRSVLIWSLGALPVAGLMIIALFELTGSTTSATELSVAILALGTVAIITGLCLMWMNVRALVAPIRTVTSALAKVQRGDLEAEVAVFDGTELGILQTGFNQMVSDVRERELIRDLFGRHVGQEVARAAMSRQMRLGGEVRDVAVLFIDVVGSTTIAATRPPEVVVELLNRFFAVVVAEIHEHGGFVNKFEGDAALAIFGAPEDLDDAAGRALAAARQMSARLNNEVPGVSAGVGVAYGPAVAGNIGAESRFEYTVIGDPVNESARLSEYAKSADGWVVASMRAVEAASATEADRWRAVDEVTLRGRIESSAIAVPVDV